MQMGHDGLGRLAVGSGRLPFVGSSVGRIRMVLLRLRMSLVALLPPFSLARARLLDRGKLSVRRGEKASRPLMTGGGLPRLMGSVIGILYVWELTHG